MTRLDPPVQHENGLNTSRRLNSLITVFVTTSFVFATLLCLTAINPSYLCGVALVGYVFSTCLGLHYCKQSWDEK